MAQARPENTERSAAPASPELPAWRSRAAQARFWLVAAAGFSADQLTKAWAVAALDAPHAAAPRRLDIIEGWLSFATVYNEGALFGLAAGRTLLLVATSALALVFLLWLFAASTAGQRLTHVALGLLLAGALGNMWDRLFNDGKVVDFIEVNLHFPPFNPWPTFNVADILLCVGVALLLPLLLKAPSPSATADHAGDA